MTDNVIDLDAYRGVRELVRLVREVADDRAYDPGDDALMGLDDPPEEYDRRHPERPAGTVTALDQEAYDDWRQSG